MTGLPSGVMATALANQGDARQTGFCAYCGGRTETKDHVPSKVFLNRPYPDDLPTVFACRDCNASFSLDEEYVACLVEIASSGPTDARDEVARILNHKPALRARLDAAKVSISEGVGYLPETERLGTVLMKLARGHACHELNEPRLDEPSHQAFAVLPALAPDARRAFEAAPIADVFPEVGSRGMQRLAQQAWSYSWVWVQPGRYRYLAFLTTG